MKPTSVKWGEIIAECGNYRDGFVAIFRKYEGQPTDEIVRGKPVKVTVNSFVDHMGIPRPTFDRWVKKASGLLSASSPRSKGDLTRDVTRAIRHEPDAVIDAIMAAPDNVRDYVYDEVKLRSAGVDTSRAAGKAAHATAREILTPVTQAVANVGARLDIEFCISAIEEATEIVERMAVAGLSGDEFDRLELAFDALAMSITRAKVASGVQS